MKMNGSEVIDAPRETVWAGLNDPKILQQCIPGCSKIETSSPTDMKATVTVKVGPVKANFAGEVKISNVKAPESYRISGKGSGGFAGFAEGGASVKLTAISPTQTQMDYDVDAQIGGKLAMLGSRLIDSTAQSYAEQFFTKFAELMKGAKPAAAKKPASKKAVAKKAPAKKVAAKKPAKKAAKKAAKK
jgi:carbon monoxide dehydrogenase subunit G